MTDRRAIAKIKIAQKDLGIEDGDYRDLLERVTGKRSAAQLSEAQCGLVLDEFKRLGWKPKVSGGRGRPARKAADHPVARKARALWLSLWNLGVVRDPSEASLEAFARRQLGVDQLQWADQTQGFRLIEALKAMAQRHGWSQSGDPSPLELTRRLVEAQRLGLTRLGASQPEWADPWLLDAAELAQMVPVLGREIRNVMGDPDQEAAA